jgi:hypothetical protein
MAGDAPYCVFRDLAPGVPATIDIYRIDEQPCVVTRDPKSGKTIRLADAKKTMKGRPTCAAKACTARNEYGMGNDYLPYVVLFRAPDA